MTEVKFFNLTFRYLDDVNIPLKTWDKINNRTAFSASLLDIYLKFDTNGNLSIRHYGKGVIRNCVLKKERPRDDKQKKRETMIYKEKI